MSLTLPSHIVMACPRLEEMRRLTGLSILLNSCRLQGLSELATFQHLLNGLDADGNPVGRAVSPESREFGEP